MSTTHPIKVTRNDRVGGVVRRALPVLDEVKRVTVTGGRSTVATMSQVNDQIVAARPQAVLEHVQRDHGATWTWVLPD